MFANGDPHVERLLRMLQVGGELGALHDVAARRRGLSHLAEWAGSIGDPPCVVESASLAVGVEGRIYRPCSTNGPQPALIYVHGGGFVAGNLDTHDGVCRRLALGSQRVVIAIAYRRAPEAIFPTAHQDVLDAVHALAEGAQALGLNPDRLALAGDLVGAGIAMSTCLALSDTRAVGIERLGLMCPILDLERDSPSRRRYARGHFVEWEAVRRDFELYCPEDVLRAGPKASPLRMTDLTALPPTIVHTAERDPFRDDGEDLARRLEPCGRLADHVGHEGMIHYFYALPGLIPRADPALDRFARALRA